MANSSKARELKQVRSHTVDRTCNTIDHQLSEWFFNRMMGLRMEARPASVGKLERQRRQGALDVTESKRLLGVLASFAALAPASAQHLEVNKPPFDVGPDQLDANLVAHPQLVMS